MKKKENEIKKCPICGGDGYINVSIFIMKGGAVIPIVTAPCPRCVNPY